MKIKDITRLLEEKFPLALQENYDNSGLQVGSGETEITGVLISVDITNEVIDEAISLGFNLVISHHPLIFGGLKKLTGANYIEKLVLKAIKNDISLYAIHTNLDNSIDGTNSHLAKLLGLNDLEVLLPMKSILKKLVTFCPVSHAEQVREAIFEAGAGHIGNYDNCSFNINGKGSFRGGMEANPFVGNIGEIHFEDEVRVETIFPSHLQSKVINAMIEAHPYEEVAYDIYPLENTNHKYGAGIIGRLNDSFTEVDFLNNLKKIVGAQAIKHTNLLGKKIKTVAICGGSGAFLIKTAIQKRADIYISGDIKYHEYFDADGKIIIAEVGHYLSEQFTKDILFGLIQEKFPTFAVQKSAISSCPINYL